MTNSEKKEALLGKIFDQEMEDLLLAQSSRSFVEELKNKKNDEDDDQNFIKKDESLKELEEKKVAEEINKVVVKLQKRGSIKPEGNQQRNLDRETGGLEAEEQKESDGKDFWDGRSEEVDKMGSVNAFQKGSIKAMIWRYKKKKLDEIKDVIKGAAAAVAVGKKGKHSEQGNINPLGGFEQQGYVQRLRNLKQDRTETFGKGNQGGGAYM